MSLSRPSSAAVDRYKRKTYAQYVIRVRFDSKLYTQLSSFMDCPDNNLNQLVRDLLSDYFALKEALD